MNIITSSDIAKLPRSSIMKRETFSFLEQTLLHKYFLEDWNLEQARETGFDTRMLYYTLEDIFNVTGGKFEDITFLDLGCGSNSCSLNEGFDNYMCEEQRTFEPWLARALHEVGARVIGIDIGNLDGEEFEHYSLNLLNENALSFIPKNSVDYVHSRLLFSSPMLEKMLDTRDFPELAKKVKDISLPYWSCGDQTRLAGEVMKQRLLPQIERVLKPEGSYICQED